MVANQSSVEGGCACKAIRYRISGEPGFSFHCQCRDCQYLSGTGHTSAIIYDRDGIHIDGELNWYEREAPSGNRVRSGFCSNCGTHVINHNSGYPKNAFITVGTLDDPSRFKPTKILYREEGHDWDFVDPELDNS